MQARRTKKTCVYCGGAGKMTREHVFPAFLDDMLFPQGRFALIAGPNKLTTGETVVRDVCAHCNNGVLADLDTYGKSLAQRYFQYPVTDIVRFEYDYHMLLRWLLKVSYNACRAFNAPNPAYEAYVPYIMGQTARPPKSALLVSTWKPSFYEGHVWYPTDVYSSVLIVPNRPDTGLVLANMLTIWSYAFLMFGWRDGAVEEGVTEAIAVASQQFGAMPLDEGGSHVFLSPAVSTMDYIQHRDSQIEANPWMAMEPSEEMRRRVPTYGVIPVELPLGEYKTYGKCVIGTIPEAPGIALLASDKLHPGLIMVQLPPEEHSQVPENHRASARMVRQGERTYVDIIDHYALDEPFFADSMGTQQPQVRWQHWRDAIRDSDNWLYIGLLTPGSTEKMVLVSKIRVFSIEEE